MSKDDSKPNKSEGHRGRLRDRFLQSGLDGFLDYEVVELLLTLGTPRRDCKQLAKQAIRKFGTLSKTLDAPSEKLQEIKGIGPANIFGLKLMLSVSERCAKENLTENAILESPESIYQYLRERIGKEEKEHFSILCFDIRRRLIIDDVSVGTLNASLIHPREVFKKAILNNSAYVVLAHNHPSGDPTPSEEDVITTKRLLEAGKILGISVTDHLIISRNSYVSLRERGVI